MVVAECIAPVGHYKIGVKKLGHLKLLRGVGIFKRVEEQQPFLKVRLGHLHAFRFKSNRARVYLGDHRKNTEKCEDNRSDFFHCKQNF